MSSTTKSEPTPPAARCFVLRSGLLKFFLEKYCKPPENGGCRLVAIMKERTWTNEQSRNHVSSLHSLLMQLCALETHMRMSRNLEKCVDLRKITGPAKNPLHVLFWPKQAAQNYQEISMWVGLALRDSCKTR